MGFNSAIKGFMKGVMEEKENREIFQGVFCITGEVRTVHLPSRSQVLALELTFSFPKC
jgi:hypothetical protein